MKATLLYHFERSVPCQGLDEFACRIFIRDTRGLNIPLFIGPWFRNGFREGQPVPNGNNWQPRMEKMFCYRR